MVRGPNGSLEPVGSTVKQGQYSEVGKGTIRIKSIFKSNVFDFFLK